MKIRLSPSGTVLKNSSGGDAEPGSGFPLRLADNRSSAGALVLNGTNQPMPNGGGGAFLVGLANPNPNLQYGARGVFVLRNNSAAVAEFAIGAQWRVDGGAWVQDDWRFEYNQQSATIASMCCVFDVPLQLGSALNAPVLQGSSLLEIQFTAAVLNGTGAVAGDSMYAELRETL